MSSARHSHGVVVLDGKLYAVGGTSSSLTEDYEDEDDEETLAPAIAAVERYDPPEASEGLGTWKNVAPMQVARTKHGVAVLGGQLYAIGGFDPTDACLTSVERYNPLLDNWELVQSISQPLRCINACVLEGQLYVVGLAFESPVKTPTEPVVVERYDANLNSWQVQTMRCDPALNKIGISLTVARENTLSRFRRQ
jgi:N-acetylneuraminic acid mutarotase